MTKKNTIEIKRGDFLVLRNSLNEAIWKIAATMKKRIDGRWNNGDFKLIYSLAKGTQDIIFENDFTVCVAGVVKQ